MDFFKKETKTTLQAIEYAQLIAHAPMVFQASRILRDSGILQAVVEGGKDGIILEDIVSRVNMSHYGVRVLIESGLGIGLLLVNDDKYTLTKTGHFILNDAMTRVNMDFSHDVCYNAMFHLEDSIKNKKPEGLKVFGEWNTIYEALSVLPAKVAKSWFDYDHFYSDDAFPVALPLVFNSKPKKLLDVGGNTGKWSIACANHDSDVHVTFVDLPGQINLAKKNIEKHGLSARISFHETNLLDVDQKLPKGYDAIWMSQFLDCFSENEITSILNRCHEAVNDDGFVYIMEPFWDRQRFEAAAFSLQQCSLYFTTVANGNSQMYDSKVFLKCVADANLEVVEQTDQIGMIQTLLKCRKK
jgi:2-polyprenyl-3-methyl-5-hydroxy-6-metoxy-1,4-benzoquinol methylase